MATVGETESGLSKYVGSWVLDPARTSIEFHTKTMWILNVKGTFKAAEGSATVTDTGAVTGTLVVDAASIDTKNKRRDQHLRSADFFETDSHPTLTFTATGAQPSADGHFAVQGELTIHGQTRPLELQASAVPESDGSVLVSTEVPIKRSEWGLTWAKMGTGLDNRVVVKARYTRS